MLTATIHVLPLAPAAIFVWLCELYFRENAAAEEEEEEEK